MRKVVILLSAGILALLLAGCGSQQTANTNYDENIKTTAESFLNAMQDGDLAEMYSFADYEAVSGDKDIIGYTAIDRVEGQLAEALGMTYEDFDSEIYSDDQLEVKEAFLDGLLNSYELGEISETDGVGTVNVKITAAFDVEKAKEIDMSDKIAELVDFYDDTLTEDLADLRATEGDFAANSRMFDQMSGPVLIWFTAKAFATGETVRDLVLTVENTDEGWLVTDISAK